MKIIDLLHPFPLLSSRDLATWCPQLSARVSGLRIQRVFVPQVLDHPDRFLKQTLVVEFSSRTGPVQLYLSLRPQECTLLLLDPPLLRPEPKATRSSLELLLSKVLPGQTLRQVRALKDDRAALFEFSDGCQLHLILIPGKPEARVIERGNPFFDPPSRNLSPEEAAKIPVHPEWTSSPEILSALYFNAQTTSLLKRRQKNILTRIDRDLRQVQSRIESLKRQKTLAETEQDPATAALLLQAHLHEAPRAESGVYLLINPETGALEPVPADPRRAPKEQMEHLFQRARRRRRKIAETQERTQALEHSEARLSSLRMQTLMAETRQDLEALEGLLGLGPQPESGKKESRLIASFTGRQIRSQEGLLILTGRNAAENQELTFKIARGNDLWLHVKGRPGAHTVIVLPPKRTASLETLLDAAHLCILHSGGREWGKTEVDYTFRKNVKRIKNQTEVSYVGNKTLVISLDEDRIKRLSEQ